MAAEISCASNRSDPPPIRSHGPGPTGLPILALVVLAPVLFWPFTLENFDFPKMSLLIAATLGILASAVAGWAVAPAPGGWNLPSAWGGWLRKDWIGLGMVLLLLSATVSTMAAVDPATAFWGEHRGHRGWLTWAGYFILFWGARCTIRTWHDVGTLLRGALIGCWAAVAYGILQMVGADPLQWEGQARFGAFWRPPSTLGHPIPLGSFLAMCFPWVLHFGWQDRGRLWAVGLWMALGTGIVLATLGTYSRGAWLSLACGLSVWVILTANRKSLVFGSLLAGSVLAAIGAVFLWNPGGAADAALARLHDSSTWKSRLADWEIALAIFRSHPILGVGPDNLQLIFPAFRTLDQWIAEWNTIPTHAHNEGLQILATQGLLGGAAMLVLIVGILRGARRAWFRVQPEDRPWLRTVLASLAALVPVAALSFLTPGFGPLCVVLLAILSRAAAGIRHVGEASALPHAAVRICGVVVLVMVGGNLVFGVQREETSVLPALAIQAAAVAAGIVLTRRPVEPEARGENLAWSYRPYRLAAAGVVSLLVLVGGYRLVLVPILGSSLVRQGVGLGESDPIAAMAALDEAVRRHPQAAVAWERLAAAAPQAAEAATSPGRRQRFYRRGEEAYRELVRRQPGKGSHRLGWSRLEARTALYGWGDPEEALRLAKEGVALETPNPLHLAGVAESCLALGRMKSAEQYVAAGLKDFPNYGPLLEQAGFLALSRGEVDLAVHLLERSLVGHRDPGLGNPAAARANLVAGYHRLGNWEGVCRHAPEALQLAPHAWTVRLAYAQGLEELRRWDEASLQYAEVLRVRPHHEGALQAQRRLSGWTANTAGTTSPY